MEDTNKKLIFHLQEAVEIGQWMINAYKKENRNEEADALSKIVLGWEMAIKTEGAHNPLDTSPTSR